MIKIDWNKWSKDYMWFGWWYWPATRYDDETVLDRGFWLRSDNKRHHWTPMSKHD